MTKIPTAPHDPGAHDGPPLPRTDVLLFDGFEDLDAVGPLEVLAAAGFPTRPVRPAGHPTSVHSAHGLRIEVADELGAGPELVVVPGGGWFDDTATGVRAQCAGPLPAELARLHDSGTVLASVCTGAMVLAAAGVLTGRPAVTNRLALDGLAAAGADVRRDARVVDDGSVVTSGGPAAGLDMALRLVERWAGPAAAERAADELEHTPVGPVLRQIGVR
jgi:transcriptional regulator GlxA family with amidase domain